MKYDKQIDELVKITMENIGKISDPVEIIKNALDIINTLAYIDDSRIICEENKEKTEPAPAEKKPQDTTEAPKVEATQKADKKKVIEIPSPIEVKEEQVTAPSEAPLDPNGIKAKIHEAIRENKEEQIPMPKQGEDIEERKLRRTLVAKHYGSMTLGEAMSPNSTVLSYILPEGNLVRNFAKLLSKVFNDTKKAQEYLSRYILEGIGAKTGNYLEVTLDKFLLTVCPYLEGLCYIYTTPLAEVNEVIKTFSNGVYKTVDGVNISNYPVFVQCIHEYNDKKNAA